CYTRSLLDALPTSEGLVDGFGQLAGGLTAAVGAQAVPVEGVVPHLGSVVEQASAGGLDDLFQALAFVLGACDQVVQVDHVGVVVLAVVVLQGLSGDVRLQGVLSVGKRGKFERHGLSPFQGYGAIETGRIVRLLVRPWCWPAPVY